jgi:hypothetical protein
VPHDPIQLNYIGDEKEKVPKSLRKEVTEKFQCLPFFDQSELG